MTLPQRKSEGHDFVSPTGSPIRGTLETLMGISIIDFIDKDGSPSYAGDTDVLWDEQKPVKRDGKFVYVDENGDEWAHDQIRRLSNWSIKDSELALSQGWDLFERDDGYLSIQKHDDSNAFHDDFIAFAFVKDLADNGSDIHKKAIRLHGTKWR